jgi:hypothetical protein
MIPIIAMVISVPTEKINEMLKVLPIDILPCELINPTTRGMLDK